MTTIRRASFRRIVESGEGKYAEIEADTDLETSPRLLAYFRKEGNGRYQLVRVAADDADPEIDWFDNAAHAASRDLTASLFSGPSHGSGEDRPAFGRRLLEFGDVREQLDRHL